MIVSRRASDLGRRPGARRGRRRGDRQPRARRAQPRVRAPVQHRARRAARRLARRSRCSRRGCRRASGACATTRSARSTRRAACARRSRAPSAGDEIGDLSRSFASVLARLAAVRELPGERWRAGSSHELRTPVAVVRSSLENLERAPLPDEARVYIDARAGRPRRGSRDPHAHDRGDAARAERSRDVERERFDLVRGGRRLRRRLSARVSATRAFACRRCRTVAVPVDGAPDLFAQMLDKLVANAVEFAHRRRDRRSRSRATSDSRAPRRRATRGRRCRTAWHGRLFDSMVSVRDRQRAATRRTSASASTSCA